ncbi:DUF1152 domain-containing protein [Mariniblastus fucicola]|uniref:DUF1152 domain-containing protein n=1 Tax=Mariniblastus fucicola TaxID=980251 RepID=A0A5B9PCR4_9BACT|nr:DUF1152 domain-containing protein [Mariniblastus fucicola]QEG24537.1 hypothetical protein MFFC18_44570 [Mariniblastus fucicola]
MELAANQLFNRLSNAERILVAGAGGGFDVYSGIPLYLALKAQGKSVHLANLSFASLRDDGNRLTEASFEVTADTAGSDTYFPERVLSRWFAEKLEQDVSVFAFTQCGARPLLESYQHLVEKLNLDAIVLVDGGTDSLMRGDEVGLGTPSEDLVSMTAVNQLDLPYKILSCLGFGVDRFHGVCHAQFLEAVADLTKSGGFLGAFSVLPNTVEAEHYLDLVEYSTQRTPSRPSIVNTSIASAIAGHFGNHQVTDRTKGSELWISPLMSMYWSFELEAVMKRNLYAVRLLETESFFEVTDVIRSFRNGIAAKDWQAIPD